MKKKSVILLGVITALALCAIVFSACAKSLPTPEGVSVRNDKVSWDAVDGADAYLIMLNGDDSTRFLTKETNLNLKKVANDMLTYLNSGKENTLQVSAVALNEASGLPEGNSKWSDSISFVFYKTAPEIRKLKYLDETGIIQWQKNDASADIHYIAALDGTECDLYYYNLAFDANKGLYNLLISDLASFYEKEGVTLTKDQYDFVLYTKIEGYEDGKKSEAMRISLSGAEIDPEDPENPEDPEDPEDPDQPDEPYVVSITASYSGGDVAQGEELNPLSISVYAKYSDDTDKVADYYTIDFDSKTVGTKTVTITFREKTATFQVNVIEKTGFMYLDAGSSSFFDAGAKIYCYIWYDSPTFRENGSWPGVEMTKVGDRYRVAVDDIDHITGIIFTRFDPYVNVKESEPWNRIELTQGNARINYSKETPAYIITSDDFTMGYWAE